MSSRCLLPAEARQDTITAGKRLCLPPPWLRFFEELFNESSFCAALGAALLEERLSAVKEELAAKQAAVQDLGKDPGGSPSWHISPPASR